MDEEQPSRQFKRINVAVVPETLRAIENIVDKEGISLTEAVRRLIGYGDFVYRNIKEENAQILIKSESETKEVVLL